ncbi:MAG: RimK family alpha-L-glutamate ligase [Myxococcaceae bacterium]|nr:RimK family alpha-L-glutamate ligase [Myxococcaceae bacterium]
MRLYILSRSETIPSTKRLVEVAKARGHKARVLDPLKVEIALDGNAGQIFYKRQKLAACDVVIPRIAQSVNVYGLAVLNQFANAGVALMNDANGIGQARNKMRALQLLSASGIAVPATVLARDPKDIKAMVNLVGGVPVVVKLLQGQEKTGVMVCETLQSLEAALEAVLGLGHQIIVQQYVKKTGQDLRVFVVGGRALAAVRRIPRPGRLAHTLLRGARLEKTTLTEAQRRAAVEATRLMGLEVAAVDLLDVRGTPKVFEVNASPAIAPMEAATGVDLATPIIERAEALVAQRGKGGSRRRSGSASKVVASARTDRAPANGR